MELVDLQPVDRKSIAHFESTDRVSLHDNWNGGNGYMFFEDVHTQIMPYRPERRPGFSIAVDPNEDELQQRVMAIFAPNEPLYCDITDHISEFMREVAGQIAYRGIVHYEITQVETIPAKIQWRRGLRGIPVGERLYVPLVIPGRVFTIWSRVLQVIPRAEWKRGRPVAISLPKSKVWSIGVPEALGGMRGYRHLRRSLVVASEVMPRFAKVPNLFAVRDLDLNVFLAQRHPLVAKGSATWGWPARGLWHMEVLEYYQLHRELRFARSLAILREHILAAMNELLVKTKVPAQLMLQGLPSPNDIEDCIQKLASGDASFQECYDVIRL